MTTIDAAPATEQSDLELVSQCIAGNRDAFGRVVARYQALICSLAYSATGNLSQSQDLAQETFVIAWQQLPELREPAKLRSWLCGIVRNRIHKALRRQGTEPDHAGESLEAAQELPSSELLPFEQAISREEEIVLWRSLERIPEIYREPLIFVLPRTAIDRSRRSKPGTERRRGAPATFPRPQCFCTNRSSRSLSAPGKDASRESFHFERLWPRCPPFPSRPKPRPWARPPPRAAQPPRPPWLPVWIVRLSPRAVAHLLRQLLRLSCEPGRGAIGRGARTPSRHSFAGISCWTLGFFIPFAAWVLSGRWQMQKDHLSWFGLLPGLLVIYILVTFVAFIATHRKRRAGTSPD